jgi:hypothetical protein
MNDLLKNQKLNEDLALTIRNLFLINTLNYGVTEDFIPFARCVEVILKLVIF